MAISHRDFTSGDDLVVHEVQGLFTRLMPAQVSKETYSIGKIDLTQSKRGLLSEVQGLFARRRFARKCQRRLSREGKRPKTEANETY